MQHPQHAATQQRACHYARIPTYGCHQHQSPATASSKAAPCTSYMPVQPHQRYRHSAGPTTSSNHISRPQLQLGCAQHDHDELNSTHNFSAADATWGAQAWWQTRLQRLDHFQRTRPSNLESSWAAQGKKCHPRQGSTEYRALQGWTKRTDTSPGAERLNVQCMVPHAAPRTQNACASTLAHNTGVTSEPMVLPFQPNDPSGCLRPSHNLSTRSSTASSGIPAKRRCQACCAAARRRP